MQLVSGSSLLLVGFVSHRWQLGIVGFFLEGVFFFLLLEVQILVLIRVKVENLWVVTGRGKRWDSLEKSKTIR